MNDKPGLYGRAPTLCGTGATIVVSKQIGLLIWRKAAAEVTPGDLRKWYCVAGTSNCDRLTTVASLAYLQAIEAAKSA